MNSKMFGKNSGNEKPSKAVPHKVVYNDCFGGFSLSKKAVQKLADMGMEKAVQALAEHHHGFLRDSYYIWDLERHDPRLVQVVEELGGEAGGECASLAIATIEGNRYRIDEYDGNESVQEPNDITDWTVIE